MRVLVAHTNQMPELNARLPLPGRESCHDDILAFGNGYAQIAVTPVMSWTQILAACPPGWEPDVYIHWSPEYNVVPEGLEHANCLTVGAFGDWNLGGQAIHAVGSLFDVLYADREGGVRLRNAGFTNVDYVPLWAFDPTLHRVLPATEANPANLQDTRDLDIVMIGNFNPHVQQERAHWLARVARLSAKHRVLLTSGVYGEEYTRLMNRAKIVFNRSIRGEINMRAYEAPACGALLFYEESNPEIRELFTDGQECVLYNENNLEERLAFYLAPENEAQREAIAEAGRRKVQAHTYAHHFTALLNQLEPRVKARHEQPPVGERAFCSLPPTEQTLRRATQWLTASTRQIVPLAVQRLTESLANAADSDAVTRAQLLNALAVAKGEWARCLPASHQRVVLFREALAHSAQALHLAPNFLLAHVNLGCLQHEAGQSRTAAATLRQLWATVQARAWPDYVFTGPAFPHGFDFYSVGWQRAWADTLPGSEAWREAMYSLLVCRVAMLLGELSLTQNDFGEAALFASESLAHRPALAEAHLLQARALRALGHVADADAVFAQSCERMPFHFAAWHERARLRLDTRRYEAARELLTDWQTVLAACPVYAEWQPTVKQLQAEARALEQQAANEVAVTRLLAFPDWRNPLHWQAIVADFARTYSSADPILLMLRADPAEQPDAARLITALHTFLTHDLRLSPNALPNITLVNTPLAPQERWKLVQAADVLLADDRLPAVWRELANALSVSVRPCHFETEDPINRAA